MKIGANTVAVLKNFATINPSILIKPGNSLATQDRSSTIFAFAEIEETITSTMAIYDLPQFLNLFGMMSDPVIDVQVSQNYAVIRDGNTTAKYTFAEPSLINSPPPGIKTPDVITHFELQGLQLQQLMRGAGVMQLPEICIKAENGNLYISAVDPENPSSNMYEMHIGETKEKFKAFLKIENFKQLIRTYKVSVTNRLVLFESIDPDTTPVSYWVAVLQHSKFT